MPCDSCVYFVYDDEIGMEVCMADVDEDDQVRMMESKKVFCPYYRLDDEYGVVRHQM